MEKSHCWTGCQTWVGCGDSQQAENLMTLLELPPIWPSPDELHHSHRKQRSLLSQMQPVFCILPFVQSKSSGIRFPWSHTQGCSIILLCSRDEQLGSAEGWKSWRHLKGSKTIGWRWIDNWSWVSQPKLTGGMCLACAPCCQSRRMLWLRHVRKNCCSLWPLMVFAALHLKMMIKVIKLSGTKTDGELAGASEGFPAFS